MVTSVVAVVEILYLAYNGDRDQYCIATISRMVGVWNADIIQHFTETASGSTTIRSFGQESRFMETNLELINAYQQPNLYHIGAMLWPCFRLDILSLVMFAFALVLLITLPGVTNPSSLCSTLGPCFVWYYMHLQWWSKDWDCWENSCGQILIDGIDIRTIGLQDPRSRLSIIPQEPTMFKTLRSNLDPLVEYTDQQIWEALDKCQLGEEIRKKEEKLDSEVVENGENWSLGQRQLVCLGRALLKKSKILVHDKATASLDTATDSLIQRTIRDQFSGSTIISVSHRIDSVLDSDMILLLDQGLIVEYDHPRKLLENKSSAFTKLVAEYTLRSI